MPQPYDKTSKRAYMAELLNDASIDCVLALDTELRVTSWNKMCETFTGKVKEAVMGRRLTDIFPQMATAKEMAAALGNALIGLKSFVPVEKGSLPGEYMETHVIPLKDVLDHVVGVLVVRHDVAHRQIAEQELKRLNYLLTQKARELEKRNAELVSFSRVTSHDLKEPLRRIHIFAQMLLDRKAQSLDEEGVSLFGRIQRSAKRAEALTDDIVAFAQLHQISEPLTDVDLELTLKISLNKLQEEIETTKTRLEADKLPIIAGYRMLLQQLFQNLLNNSIKFRQPNAVPSVFISTGVSASDDLKHQDTIPDTKYTWLRFTDNGIGFEPSYKERVFELFQRLHQPGVYSGNGIGLSLCKKIMELHGGFITSESEPGTGSTFTCYFPQKRIL